MSGGERPGRLLARPIFSRIVDYASGTCSAGLGATGNAKVGRRNRRLLGINDDGNLHRRPRCQGGTYKQAALLDSFTQAQFQRPTLRIARRCRVDAQQAPLAAATPQRHIIDRAPGLDWTGRSDEPWSLPAAAPMMVRVEIPTK